MDSPLKNDHIKNDEHLTGDETLVKGLHLDNIPENIYRDELVKYYESYCELVPLQVLKSGASLEPSKGHQEQTHIMKIPDDCLLKILEFLSLNDQLNFLKFCSRSRNIYQWQMGSFHKSINFEMFRSLTEWDMRGFFLIFGRHVQSFESKHTKSPIFRGLFYEYFKANCVNLKSLVIWHCEIIQGNMSEIITNTSKLERLELRHCKLSDDTLVDLKSKKNLKSLSFAVNDKLSGASLLKLPASIESLNLQSCYEILSNNFDIEAWKALSNLKVLNIMGLRNLPSDIFNHLTLIESLTFSIYENIPYLTIAKLPNLKHIEIEGVNTFIFEKLLDQLVKYKSQQLEHLHICNADGMRNRMFMKILKFSELQKLFIFNAEALKYNTLIMFTKLRKLEHLSLCYCQHVSDVAMMRLVLGCPKLRVLDLSLCFNRQSEKLVLSVIENVARLVVYKKNNRQFPIHIYGDFFTEESIRSHRNLPTSKIIKICHTTYEEHEDLSMYIDDIDIDF